MNTHGLNVLSHASPVNKSDAAAAGTKTSVCSEFGVHYEAPKSLSWKGRLGRALHSMKSAASTTGIKYSAEKSGVLTTSQLRTALNADALRHNPTDANRLATRALDFINDDIQINGLQQGHIDMLLTIHGADGLSSTVQSQLSHILDSLAATAAQKANEGNPEIQQLLQELQVKMNLQVLSQDIDGTSAFRELEKECSARASKTPEELELLQTKIALAKQELQALKTIADQKEAPDHWIAGFIAKDTDGQLPSALVDAQKKPNESLLETLTRLRKDSYTHDSAGHKLSQSEKNYLRNACLVMGSPKLSALTELHEASLEDPGVVARLDETWPELQAQVTSHDFTEKTIIPGTNRLQALEALLRAEVSRRRG